jgi:hypothetical protein
MHCRIAQILLESWFPVSYAGLNSIRRKPASCLKNPNPNP